MTTSNLAFLASLLSFKRFTVILTGREPKKAKYQNLGTLDLNIDARESKHAGKRDV